MHGTSPACSPACCPLPSELHHGPARAVPFLDLLGTAAPVPAPPRTPLRGDCGVPPPVQRAPASRTGPEGACVCTGPGAFIGSFLQTGPGAGRLRAHPVLLLLLPVPSLLQLLSLFSSVSHISPGYYYKGSSSETSSHSQPSLAALWQLLWSPLSLGSPKLEVKPFAEPRPLGVAQLSLQGGRGAGYLYPELTTSKLRLAALSLSSPGPRRTLQLIASLLAPGSSLTLLATRPGFT